MNTFTTTTRRTDRTAGLHYAETPVRQRAVLTCGSWRRVTRRIVCGLTCALTVSSLLMPSISFAAEWVEVDGNTYTAGVAAGDGSTWAWDGTDNMTLNGYNGGGIAAGGKLNVSYEGNNTVANESGDGISVVDGANESAELNISGTGTLTATAEGDALYSERDMTISGTGAVNATGDASGIYTQGDLSINTSGTVTAKGTRAEGIRTDGDITIADGGTVDTCSEQDFGIIAKEALTVSNSTLIAQGSRGGIYAFEGLTIDAATVRAYAYDTPSEDPVAIFTDEGDTAAIMAVVNSADGSISGTINIVDSVIETPNGGRICDVRFVDTEPADAPYQRGQTIGTANDVITDLDSDAIAKRAVIVPVETPQAKPESKPKITTAAATIKHVDTKDTLAATGDTSVMGVVAAAITGMAAVVAGIFTSRKRS